MEDERAELMRRVGRALILPAEQSGLTVVRSDGTRPVVAALPSDLLADVLQEVRESGGSANVVVREGSRLMVLAMLVSGPVPSTGEVAAHSDMRMDMLLELIRQEGRVRTCVTETGDVLAVDESRPLLAPA